jgi:hypothetical protein
MTGTMETLCDLLAPNEVRVYPISIDRAGNAENY